MKKQTRQVLLGAATCAALVGGTQVAKAADTAAVNIDARIIQAIAITAGATLDFGTVSVAAATTGTVAVRPDGSDLIGGGGGVTAIGASATAAGTFTVKGAANIAYQVIIPATVSITETVGGVAKMQVNGFNWDPTTAADVTGAAFPLTAAPTGTSVAYALGGTLNVGAGQLPGIYQGTVTLTAAYQ